MAITSGLPQQDSVAITIVFMVYPQAHKEVSNNEPMLSRASAQMQRASSGFFSRARLPRWY